MCRGQKATWNGENPDAPLPMPIPRSRGTVLRRSRVRVDRRSHGPPGGAPVDRDARILLYELRGVAGRAARLDLAVAADGLPALRACTQARRPPDSYSFAVGR